MVTKTGAPQAEPQVISEQSGSNSGGAAVALSALSHAFGALQVLKRLEFEVEAGRVLGVVGPSGCGKSTLLEIVSGLREPSGGVVSVKGASDAPGRLARCTYMPQRDLLLGWLPAIDNASLALRVRGTSRAEARRAVAPLFERFGLTGFETTRPSELSGGMRQRVAFLRTLAGGKPVLLLDEPFASLDAITRAEMQQWLAGALGADHRTVLLVTHDVEEALYLSDRIVILSARPAEAVDEIEPSSPRAPDRAATVSSPQFAAQRERALRALQWRAR